MCIRDRYACYLFDFVEFVKRLDGCQRIDVQPLDLVADLHQHRIVQLEHRQLHVPVSYTHLDVYKRQAIYHADNPFGSTSAEKLMRRGEMVLSDVNLCVAPRCV